MSVTEDKLRDLRAALERNERQLSAMTAQPSIADANALSEMALRWSSLYQMLGDSPKTPYAGEKPRSFLKRCADGVRKHTENWKNYTFHDSQQAQDLEAVSNLIFAEATAHAKRPPADGTRRPMREIVTHPNSKTRTEFVGDSRDYFAPFMHPTKFAITKINRPE